MTNTSTPAHLEIADNVHGIRAYISVARERLLSPELASQHDSLDMKLCRYYINEIIRTLDSNPSWQCHKINPTDGRASNRIRENFNYDVLLLLQRLQTDILDIMKDMFEESQIMHEESTSQH